MKNTDIQNLMYANTEASALYWGGTLVWQRQRGEIDPDNYVPKYNFSGKFTDDSTEEDWWIFFTTDNNGSGRQVSIADKVNPETKIFDYNINFEFGSVKFLFDGNKKIEKIFSTPINEDINNFTSMFRYCSSLQSIDVSNWNVYATDITSMFRSCSSLQSIDVSSWNVDNVSDMSSMFQSCSSLQSIDVSSWNVDNVSDMSSMFQSCSSLEEINFGNWKMCDNIKNILSGCKKLYSIKGNITNIKSNINLYSSPLTNDSAMVFVNGLSVVGETQTITFHKNTYDTLSDEQIAMATSKGWTVVRD